MKTQVITQKMITKYKDYLYEEERSQSSIEKYIRDITKYYQFLPNDKIVTKENLIAYKSSLNEQYKISSINSMLVALNSFLQFIHLEDFKLKLHKFQRRVFNESDNELSKDEYERLLKVAQSNERLYLLLQTICGTGMRVSEHKFITVEALKKKKAIINNKGKIREIFITKKLSQLLLKYCKKNGIYSGSVFITKNGNPLDRSNIWSMMKTLCKEAGVDSHKVYPHNLRHLFAITYYRLEKDIVRLADILGHSSIETTRIYTMTTFLEYENQLSRLNLVGLGT